MNVQRGDVVLVDYPYASATGAYAFAADNA